jgi:hypothetical protein
MRSTSRDFSKKMEIAKPAAQEPDEL